MTLQEPSNLFAELGFAVFERVAEHVFRPVGAPPDWWSQLDRSGEPDAFVPHHDQPFLQAFLEEAEEFWAAADRPERLNSAIWEISSNEDSPLFVELLALQNNDQNLLVFHNIDATGDGWRAQLQAGRDSQLELMRDVARRQQLELELRSAHQASEKLHRARTTFLANISHELRTPLTSILGMVDMLAGTELTADQMEYGEIVQRSATALLRLVNDVLDLSRFEAGTVELECRKIALADLAEHLMADYTPAAQAKGVEFRVELAAGLPPTIWQDALRLRQILNNLIDNGLRFTDTGHVTVTMAPDHRQGGMMVIEVTDSGMGIPEEYQQVIFDSFTQVDSSPSRDYGGTGLGLAIANKLANCLGGHLSLQSKLGAGSKFSICIPYRAPVPMLDDEAAAAQPFTQDTTSLSGIRVLVAEDNAVNRKYIRHVVQKANGEVLEADNGGAVIELLREHEVDVILMDCQMPVMDGLEVTAVIRNSERRTGGHLPIVAVTAHAMRPDIDRCLAVGMDEHITKPFKPDKLRSMVRRAASLKINSVAGSLRAELAR